MNDQQGGHIQEFDEQKMKELLQASGLTPVVFIPAQPHYFISHTWLFGSRMKIEAATGQVKTKGIRHFIWTNLTTGSKLFLSALALTTGAKYSQGITL